MLTLREVPADLPSWTGRSLYDQHCATGSPFAGLVLKPLVRTAENAIGVVWPASMLCIAAAIGWVVARALPKTVPQHSALRGPLAAIGLVMISQSVRSSLLPGQTSTISVLLVLLACLVVREEQASGALVGLGAALQPATLLFMPLLWLTGRRKAALSAAGTFAACTALAGAVKPRDSWTYWTDHLAVAGLSPPSDSTTGQSLHGALLRLGLHGPVAVALFLMLASVVTAVGLWRAVRYTKDNQALLAVALIGCVAIAVFPTAWQHQSLWLLLVAAGRVGRRAKDQLLWSATLVLLTTAPWLMSLPDIPVLRPVREDLPLMAALATACAVPFLPTSSEHFQTPRPTESIPPKVPQPRRVTWLPSWLGTLSGPDLLLELLMLRVGYVMYARIRGAVRTERATAEEHGRLVDSAERALHIDIEHWANHTITKLHWLERFFNWYYTSFHFGVPFTILAVLYLRRPADFRWARSTLGLITLLALIGFQIFPLAPPRLMPALGIIDTVYGPQNLTHPSYGQLTALTNPYAAMPSLHFGWSLWSAVVIVKLAPQGWTKLLGLLHPTLTLTAILVTGNHWVLDAVSSAAVVTTSFGLTHLLTRPRQVPLPLRLSPQAVTQ
nr:bifunctional glycosyltransferase 87/phosphatase PAP2 family protein [Streptomyces sp. RPT161]